MRRILSIATILFAALAVGRLVTPAAAQSLPTGFSDTIIASSIDQPCALEFTPDGRLLFTTQAQATVRIVAHGALLSTPVITVPEVITSGELGLLGVALDPRFPVKPYLYTHETLTAQRLHITRWTLTGDLAGTGDGQMTADPASAYELITDIPNQAANHNGGTVRFGPDSMLYVSLGEDADPCGAQDVTQLKGKILRLDVRSLPPGPGAALRAQITPADNPYAAVADSNQCLVYAYGLRNPFRFQIDPVRRWLVIGDVGQDTYEELDLLAMPGASAGAAPAASNFGWPWREGNAGYSTCTGSEPALAAPVFVVDRSAQGGAAIISAGAYQSADGALPSWPAQYHGDLFFSEYYSGRMWRLSKQGGSWSTAPAVAGQSDAAYWATNLAHPADFRVGPDNQLWYLSQWNGAFANTGSVHRIAWVGDTLTPPPVTGVAVRLSAKPLPARLPVVLSYTLSATVVTHLRIYDVRGRLVRELLPSRTQTPADYQVSWDGADDGGSAMPSGLYWARLEAGTEHASVKLPLLR